MNAAPPPLLGKVILITGATTGIGQATAYALAARGAKVILHARTAQRGAATVQALHAKDPSLDLELAVADLGSLAAVRLMAAEVVTRFPRLDVLVNNAGVITPTRQVSTEGYELTFAVNHLAHFLLTNLLLDALKTTVPSRIITVSSDAHFGAAINLDDLQMTQHWDQFAAYRQSKVANILFAYHLASRLATTGVTSNTLHPGVISTKLLRSFYAGRADEVNAGAATTIFLAADHSVARLTGHYFERGQTVPSAPLTYDRPLQERFWEISAQLVGYADDAPRPHS